MRLTADFSKIVRPIGKLNGMNNGPLHTYSDRSEEYKDMGVEFVRFHETHSPNSKCVEIPLIFRNFDADENDPANYFFGETDAVIKAAVDQGIEIMYRLGMGTEGTVPKILCIVPKDYAKWARIAEHIIMHYNEGWANGFHYNIEYWEIWNEADLIPYWPGGRISYLDFYTVTCNYLKNKFPHLKFGPSGFAGIYRPVRPDIKVDPVRAKDYDNRVVFFNELARRVADNEVPMDFFPWHRYAKNSAEIEQNCTIIEDLLRRYGLSHTELINTEWNGISLGRDSAGYWDFTQMFTVKHAITVIACMIVMQKYGNTKAAYYDTDERTCFCGLYNFDGTLGPHYYSMKMWKLLKQCENEVFSDGSTDTLRICGAYNGKRGAVLITNEADNDEKITLRLDNLPACNYTVTVYDSTHKLELLKKGKFSGRALSFTMEKESAKLIEFDISGDLK